MSVTVVSSLYGDRFRRFVPRWRAAIGALSPAADRVIVGSDSEIEISGVKVVASFCHWRYPQAWHLQQAVMAAETEWVWIVDIDDVALPDGLAGLELVAADVLAVGYEREGETYVPPADLDVMGDRNRIPAGSMIRTDVFRECGGFRDVALQDWALWRSLARAGATFAASDRAHYRYMRHPHTRGTTELTLNVRDEHMAEMEAELAHA